jgi:hypothetical protein
MGKLLEGRKEDITVQKPYEIIEFDNMTEFAGYVAKIFEEAERRDPEYPMSAMSEQIYAADSSANDILKIYTHLYKYLTNITYNKVIYTYFKLQIKESKVEITLQK